MPVRNTDNQKLRKSLKRKDNKKGLFSSKSRKVNFVIYVVNGLSVLNAMENTSETQYTETIVSTFNCPFLSFKGICKACSCVFPFINLIESLNCFHYICVSPKEEELYRPNCYNINIVISTSWVLPTLRRRLLLKVAVLFE